MQDENRNGAGETAVGKGQGRGITLYDVGALPAPLRELAGERVVVFEAGDARRSNSRVAAPGPAPISRMCSPSCTSAKSHGSSFRSVRFRQNEVEQNQFSRAFIFCSAAKRQPYAQRSSLWRDGVQRCCTPTRAAV